MKLPDLPPIYLRPPEVRRAIIMCTAEGVFKLHEYDGKDPVWATGGGTRLVDIKLRFRCATCGAVRHYGNEYVGTGHHRTDEKAEAAIAAELAEAAAEADT